MIKIVEAALNILIHSQFLNINQELLDECNKVLLDYLSEKCLLDDDYNDEVVDLFSDILEKSNDQSFREVDLYMVVDLLKVKNMENKTK